MNIDFDIHLILKIILRKLRKYNIFMILTHFDKEKILWRLWKKLWKL